MDWDSSADDIDVFDSLEERNSPGQHLNRSARLILTLLCSEWLNSTTYAAIEPRNTLKTQFETGNNPTESQFDNLIESSVSVTMDYGPSISEYTMTLLTSEVSIGIAGDAKRKVLRLDPRTSSDPIGATLATTVSLDNGSRWPGTAGLLAFMLELEDAGLATLRGGFVQFSADGPATTSPYAICILGAAFETSPNCLITVFSIPDPTGQARLLIAVFSVGILRRTARDKPLVDHPRSAT